jgi:hypothetical protein
LFNGVVWLTRLESIMKTAGEWRRHLRAVVSATFDPTFDPMVYAVRWARDPRCIQRGSGHRRVGAFESHGPVCRLWSNGPRWG